MFTGIIEAIGTITSIKRSGNDTRLRIQSGDLDLADVKLGDSIATNGVCLTVVELPGDGYVADISAETVSRSNFGHYKPGQRVNLEKAMTLSTRLGGHLVSGHVDGVGEVVAIEPRGESTDYWVKTPDELARYIAEKGSITVDGTSLTVNSVDGARFRLTIVPHTAQWTVINDYQVGSKVHLEVDVIARYLERLVLGDKAAQSTGDSPAGVTMGLLAKSGFLK